MKNKMKYFFIFIFFVSASCFIEGCTSTQTEAITIQGSTTMTPMLKQLAAAYKKHKDIQIIIKPMGSLNGIMALIQNKTWIACSSTPISAELIKEADQNNIHLKAFPLCRDQVIAIVHTSNPVNQLSIDQVKGLFTGSIKNWADIGGHNASVNTILREETSGTHQVWDRMVLDGKHSSSNSPVLVASNSGVLAKVAENKQAIGYISAAYLNHEVKQLTITKNKKIVPIERTLFLYQDEPQNIQPIQYGWFSF